MKVFLRLAVAVVALGSFSAQAGLFNFSYTFGDGNFASGSLNGTQNGQFIDNISNVTVLLNGSPLSGSPSLFHSGWNTAVSFWDNTVPAVVSFDANLNNFIFIDSDFPADPNFTNFFLMVNDPNLGTAFSAAQTLAGNIFSTDSPIEASWTLTNAVPEPDTYALLLAGLGLLGFVARRRKQKAA